MLKGLAFTAQPSRSQIDHSFGLSAVASAQETIKRDQLPAVFHGPTASVRHYDRDRIARDWLKPCKICPEITLHKRHLGIVRIDSDVILVPRSRSFDDFSLP